jgi:hypothetical protein
VKIKDITFEMYNDFHAVMQCEHCGHEQENKAGYHDNFYHTQVIPAMKCKSCGKDRRGMEATAPPAPSLPSMNTKEDGHG